MFLVLNTLYLSFIIKSTRGLYITYFLFTRNNVNDPIQIESDMLSSIDASQPSKIVIHGYKGFGATNYGHKIKDKLLKNENCNVILLDWSLNSNNDYNYAVTYTRIVGKYFGEHIFNVFENYNLLHFIGEGLGSHIAGIAAKTINKLNGGNTSVGKITALDPPIALFNTTELDAKLDANDAKSVVVYHCDGNGLAVFEPVGKVDFYINGGVRNQPGCHDENPRFLDIFFKSIELITCSHRMCKIFYIDSIDTNSTTALKCNSYNDFNMGLCNENERIVFGENAPETAMGTYHLNLTAHSVY